MLTCRSPILIALIVLGSLGANSRPIGAQHPIQFETRLLTVDSNEGCAVADVDGDGHLDVIAGRNWFRNGEWVARPIRLIEDWRGYVVSNGDFPLDVNQDGNVDVVAGGFIPTEVHWYENPGSEGLERGLLWNQHLLVDTALSQNEASYMHDIDGDGIPEWISNSWKRDNPLVIWKLQWNESGEASEGNTSGDDESPEIATPDGETPNPTMIPFVVGASANGHGIGFGDLNNDGREDIIVGTGWYERPEGNPFESQWTYHQDWDRHFSCPVLVRDLDGDGMNDMVWGNPHDFGLYVWKGKDVADDGSWQYDETQIDADYSQLHCLAFADLDGDGQDELITGKRVRAHNGSDPGGTEPAQICYYTIDSETGEFTRYIINRGEIGIGLQIVARDIDNDGDVDLAVAGKDGTQVLFNQSDK